MKKEFYLLPTNGRASFYGKAIVEQEDGIEKLRSYGTVVMVKADDQLYRTEWNVGGYSNWSPTTGTHIKSYCGLTKKEYLALPIWKGELD